MALASDALAETGRRDRYNANIQNLNGLQRINDERYDQTLTTLSAAFLGVSVSFIHDLVPLAQAVSVQTLYYSWVAFGLTAFMTLSSSQVSNRAIRWQASHLSPNEDPAPDLRDRNPWGRLTTSLNFLAGVAFLAGLVFTIWFAYTNTNQQQLLG